MGHGGSGGGKRLRSGLGVSRTQLPRSWPRGVAAARDARSSLPWAAQETPRRGGGARAVPQWLGPTGSRRASRSAPESPHELPPPPPPGLQGLADGPGQWRAASSRCSDQGAGRPIEGPQAPRSLPARVPGPRPRPHATETRGEGAPPPSWAEGWAARAEARPGDWSRPSPVVRRLGASQRPSLHVNFQASAAALGAGRGWEAHQGLFPAPGPECSDTGQGSSTRYWEHHEQPRRPCARERAGGVLRHLLLPPYLTVSHTCWSDLYPAATAGTVKAFGQI